MSWNPSFARVLLRNVMLGDSGNANVIELWTGVWTMNRVWAGCRQADRKIISWARVPSVGRPPAESRSDGARNARSASPIAAGPWRVPSRASWRSRASLGQASPRNVMSALCDRTDSLIRGTAREAEISPFRSLDEGCSCAACSSSCTVHRASRVFLHRRPERHGTRVGRARAVGAPKECRCIPPPDSLKRCAPVEGMDPLLRLRQLVPGWTEQRRSLEGRFPRESAWSRRGWSSAAMQRNCAGSDGPVGEDSRICASRTLEDGFPRLVT
ncbi:hypothetical protein C8Q73DRAFT_90019 [Cubamyces lactineus]|nr:hypothetical protein C8Q73DRAFT_90019 [Cubamyces lactineus]